MRFKDYYNAPDLIVIFPGRLSPCHKTHAKIYDELGGKFGDNVYIATSNKEIDKDSPFDFQSKEKIITTMFPDIPTDKIVQTKMPYYAEEIFERFPKDTKVIYAIGSKDRERLKNRKNIEEFKEGMKLEPRSKKIYYYIIPEKESTIYIKEPNDGKKVVISGSLIREAFRNWKEEEKKELFLEVYPEWNEEIFNLLNDRINRF